MDRNQIESLIGGKLVDSEGQHVGKIGMIYLDDQTNQPDWATVNTGLFGTKETFVPLENATVEGDELRVPYTKAKIKDAPRVDADEHLDVDQEQELYRHYGRDYGTTGQGVTDGRTGTGRDAVAGGVAGGVAGTAGTRGTDEYATRENAGTVGESREGQFASDRRGDATDRDLRDGDRDLRGNVDTDGVRGDRGEGMTLHEEHLNVGTERREAGKVRLRKYVVTENQSVTVPVSREEVHVERTPVSGDYRDNGSLGEEVQEVTLHEDVPVVEKDVRATEQVRLSTDEVRGEQTVSGQVSHEEVDLDEGTRAQGTGRGTGDLRDNDGRDDLDPRNKDRSLLDKAKDKLS